MKLSPGAAVSYARRRLENWPLLYEPGQEKPLEGKYAEKVTAVPSMKDTSLADPSKDTAATDAAGRVYSFAEPTEEMKKKRAPPTHFMVQYIDDCLGSPSKSRRESY